MLMRSSPRRLALTGRWSNGWLRCASSTTTAGPAKIQSLIRDPGQREILYDLDRARRAVFQISGKCRAFDLLTKSHANLMRRWAEN